MIVCYSYKNARCHSCNIRDDLLSCAQLKNQFTQCISQVRLVRTSYSPIVWCWYLDIFLVISFFFCYRGRPPSMCTMKRTYPVMLVLENIFGHFRFFCHRGRPPLMIRWAHVRSGACHRSSSFAQVLVTGTHRSSSFAQVLVTGTRVRTGTNSKRYLTEWIFTFVASG